jgi:hypothetical protein
MFDSKAILGSVLKALKLLALDIYSLISDLHSIFLEEEEDICTVAF